MKIAALASGLAVPFAVSLALAIAACRGEAAPPAPAAANSTASPSGPITAAPPASGAAPTTPASSATTLDGSATAGATAPAPRDPSWDDPMANHKESREQLLSLFSLKQFSDEEFKRRRPDQYLNYAFGTTGPASINQGNKVMAHHAISKAKCMDGLRDVVLQTDEQKAKCGADYMVPVYAGGNKDAAKFCIDIFEFPNKPCELPMVWAAPSVASAVCAYQGKRLCTQDEWNLSCRADPAGGPDQVYAYGNDLDLAVCNTEKPHENVAGGGFRCNAHTAQSAWNTCATETEPAGAYPKCKSRFGVYDQHGNIAEIMTRMDKDQGLVSQLKGSAFFYVDVARKHNEPHPKTAPRDTYPDHCNYDPRWHVEPMSKALHVNYHLGFRCCKSL